MVKNIARKKKRRFQGNTKKVPSINESDQSVSAECSRKRKLKESLNQSVASLNQLDEDDYYLFINFKILKQSLETSLACPECHQSKMQLINNHDARMGFANHLKLLCSHCNFENSFFTSKQSEKQASKQGRNMFEVNIRSVIAFREIGRGFESVSTFARCMNMCSISDPTYRNINDKLYNAYAIAANESMRKAADEVASSSTFPTHESGISMARAKIDGAWQKRGHSSANGVITVTIGNKCVDTYVLSKHCKQCEIWERRHGTPQYDAWKNDHVCSVNHTASSGAMEAAGAIKMFHRSITKNNLIYHEYLGDGDTSSFKAVVDAKPYQDYNVSPIKLECVGHVQKRLGTRLRNKVKEYKGTKTPIAGKGKLHEKAINSMQNYYGLAIRQNLGNIYAMKKAIGAILWHCTEFTDMNFRHRFCPSSKDSWCKFQRDKVTKQNTYKATISLPKWVHDIIRPVFDNLANDELLTKCVHGETQNPNEAFNNIIWTRCPKTIYVNRQVLETGVNSAVLHYNEGSRGINSVLSSFSIESGIFMERGTIQKNTKSIKKADIKSSEKTKKRRKHIRAIHKGLIVKEKEQEPAESYIAGGF